MCQLRGAGTEDLEVDMHSYVDSFPIGWAACPEDVRLWLVIHF